MSTDNPSHCHCHTVGIHRQSQPQNTIEKEHGLCVSQIQGPLSSRDLVAAALGRTRRTLSSNVTLQVNQTIALNVPVSSREEGGSCLYTTLLWFAFQIRKTRINNHFQDGHYSQTDSFSSMYSFPLNCFKPYPARLLLHSSDNGVLKNKPPSIFQLTSICLIV